MIEFDTVKKVYFIGIGGIGMSAAAGLAKASGLFVYGSDSSEVYSPAKEVLEKYSIDYGKGYDSSRINPEKADLYVISAGESLQNPEVKSVYEQDLPHIGMAEFLQYLATGDLRVVVSGTHGKSTTAGLIGHTLKSLDNSSFFVGGVLQNYNENFHFGDGHYFVFEGDEYKEEFDDPTPKFHFYRPDILVLTNLEFDHPDVFESLEALETEFRELIARLPEDGFLVYNADNVTLARLARETEVASVGFSIDNESEFKAENIEFGEFTKFGVRNKFSKDPTVKLLDTLEQYQIQLPGKINVYNTLACIAALRSLGFSHDQLALEILSFQGIKRRFEVVGKKNGVTIVDDYAHHPTAVHETLSAAREKFFPPGSKSGRLWAVFEPHTFSRTKVTLPELSGAFVGADEVLISKIYPAREKASPENVSENDVVQSIKERHPKFENHIRAVSDKDAAIKLLKEELRPGDIVVVMAVGNFNRLAYDLKN